MSSESWTHSLNELLPILINHTSRESDLPKADVLVHLLSILRVEGTPSTAHLEEKDSERPEVDELGVSVVVEEDFRSEVSASERRISFSSGNWKEGRRRDRKLTRSFHRKCW